MNSVKSETIARVRFAFLNFIASEQIDAKEICQRMTSDKIPGFSVSNFNKSFPLLPATINAKADEKKPAGEHAVQYRNLVLHLIKFLAYCKYDLLDVDERPFKVPTTINDIEISGKHAPSWWIIEGRENAGATFKYKLCQKEDFTLIEEHRELIGTHPDKDQFLLAYKGHDEFMYALFLLNEKENIVSLILLKSKKLIIGTYHITDSRTIVANFKNDNKDFWQIIIQYNKYNEDYLFGFYSKYSQKDGSPASGNVFLIKRKYVDEKSLKYFHDFAEYYLYGTRKEIEIRESYIRDFLDNDIRKNGKEINLFNQLEKFTGTYEGWFINPIGKRFENCHIVIYQNGIVKIWLEIGAPVYYLGFAKKSPVNPTKDLLYIKYDYLNELDEYRAYMILETIAQDAITLNIENHEQPLTGILSGIERNGTKPFMSRIAVVKISDDFLEYSNPSNNCIKLFHKSLETKKHETDALNYMKELGLYDFFSGEISQDISYEHCFSQWSQ
jgi:hypothetical protein